MDRHTAWQGLSSCPALCRFPSECSHSSAPRCFPEVTSSHSFSWLGPEPRGEILLPPKMRSQKAAVEENPNLLVYGRARDVMPTLRLASTQSSHSSCHGREVLEKTEQPFCHHSPLENPQHSWLAAVPSTRDFSGLIHLPGHNLHLSRDGESSQALRKCLGEGFEEENFEERMSYLQRYKTHLFVKWGNTRLLQHRWKT